MNARTQEPALLAVESIGKRFGPTRALCDVSLSVFPGEILALIGENGAGKSTLLKILSGAHVADSGSMEMLGQPFRPQTPSSSRKLGIAMIYQELNLACDLSVEDNVMLGQSGTGLGLLRRRKQRHKVREALDLVGLGTLHPGANVGQQSVATQQLIEIARALASDARLILFDEPTSSLPRDDVDRLFQIIRRLKDNGIGMIYISHFLEEVREIADRYCILRDGRNAGDGQIDQVSDPEIISMMVGRDVNELYPVTPHEPGEPRVAVRALSGTPLPHDVDLTLRRGEIFGIAGLVGAGRTELLRTLFGIDYCRHGDVQVDGRSIPRSVRARMKAGLAMLSEDRKGEGLAQDLSVIENITLGSLGGYTVCGLLNTRKRDQAALELVRQVQVVAQSGDQPISELSGGNQQKVAIARIIHQRADVLLLDEPTKGIDVGTKAEIYRLMGQIASQGKTVVFVSSYLPELLAVCDRIGVMSRGRLRQIRDARDWTEDEVMSIAIAPEGTAFDHE